MLYIAVLNKAIDFFEQNKEGKSPLHVAAMHGRFTGSQILIQNGNVNAPNSLVTQGNEDVTLVTLGPLQRVPVMSSPPL